MSQDIIEDKWKAILELIEAKWGQLTDEDIRTIKSEWENLIRALQERYGYSKEKAQEVANNYLIEYPNS